jgi:tetratricopeptide (TPR) repeat protein
MAFISDLILQGWAAGGVGGGASDSPQDLLASTASDVEKMWRCWLRAEAERNAGDIDKSMLWLQASEQAAEAAGRPAVWVAEYDTTAGRALHRSGDLAQALPFLLEANKHWREIVDLIAHGTPDRTSQLFGWVRDFLGILLSRPDAGVDPDSEKAITTWVTDRATGGLMASASECIYVSAAAQPDLGRQIGDDLLTFLPSITTPEGRKILESDIHLALGNLEQACAEPQAAMDHFDTALAPLRPLAGDPVIDYRITRLELSRANAFVRLGGFDEAVATYDRVIGAQVARGDRAAELRARYARLFARRQGGETTRFVEELRELIDDYEDFVSRTSPEELRDAKANLQAVYGLLLVTLAGQRPTSTTLADELVRVVMSLRDEPLAKVDLSGIEEAEPGVSALRLLDRRLARLPDTALLVWQPAVDGIVLMVLTSGVEPLEERLVLTTAGQDLVDAAIEAIDAAGEAGRALRLGSAPVTDLDQARIKAAGEQLAGALPPEVAAVLGAAATVIISPSADSTSQEVPFELLRVDGEYLAIRAVVARIPSLSQLVTMLAPNRRWRTPTAAAAVLRAQDPPQPDSQGTVDDHPALVEEAARALGLDPQPESTPTAAGTLDLLDCDLRLIHYLGSGMAGISDMADMADKAADDGAGLFLAENEVLPATQLSALSGARTPFVVLSACVAGEGSNHLHGRSLRGFEAALLDRGAPAVVAPAYALPEDLCAGFTQEFYRATSQAPAGEALRLARERQRDEGLHPVAWSSFTLHGDPWASLVDVAPPAGSARFTQDWPAWLTRWLATGREQDRAECLRTLSEARDALPELAEVITLIDHLERAMDADADALARRISDADAEGGAALRILIAVERLRALAEGDEPLENAEALKRKEIGTALTLAVQLDDAYAFLLLASHQGEILRATESVRVLEHAEGCADALADDATALAPLLERLDAVSSRAGSWSDWLLRYVGADTMKALSEAMSAIRRERHAGTIPPELADALWSLMKSFRVPGRLDDEALTDARSQLSNDAGSLRTLEILDLFDRIVGAGKNIDPQNVEDGLHLARESGHSGAIARFLLLSSQVAYTNDDVGAARDRTMMALELLDHLTMVDNEYSGLTTSAASNARIFNTMLGDTETAKAIEQQYL